MLSFDLSTLDSQAVHVDGLLAADDAVWVEGDTLPADGVRVTGRISAAGPGRFYFSGRFEGEVDAECRRCLTPVRASVRDDLVAVFAEAGDEEVEDDPDVYQLDGRAQQLDLRPAIREQWLLSVPAFVECRADCKGLCPTCGADLNGDGCECAPADPDPRWAALRNLRGDAS